MANAPTVLGNSTVLHMCLILHIEMYSAGVFLADLWWTKWAKGDGAGMGFEPTTHRTRVQSYYHFTKEQTRTAWQPRVDDGGTVPSTNITFRPVFRSLGLNQHGTIPLVPLSIQAAIRFPMLFEGLVTTDKVSQPTEMMLTCFIGLIQGHRGKTHCQKEASLQS